MKVLQSPFNTTLNNPNGRFELYLVNAGSGSTFFQKIGELVYNESMATSPAEASLAARCRGVRSPAVSRRRRKLRQVESDRMSDSTCAVYNKKLLWRANLYIDENNGQDWNDVHPWNAPAAGAVGPAWWSVAWGHNEWNTPEAGYAGVAGGQVIEILPCTIFTNETIVNTVAYGWGDSRSVFQYNNDLSDQQNAISEYRNNNPESDINNLNWNQNTIAPGNSWQNYIFPKRVLDTVGDDQYYRYRSLTAQELQLNPDQHVYSVNNSTRRIPGLTTYWLEDNNFIYDSSQNPFSTGVDCSGFLFRSMQYAGRNYVPSGWDNVDTFMTDEKSTLISAGTDREFTPENLEYLVPGDVLAWREHHIVIILDIDEPGVNGLERGNIRFIHSGQGQFNEWRVMTDLQWDSDNGLGDFWSYQARRLRMR